MDSEDKPITKTRKVLILGLFYIDLFLHCLLIFGWSSIDQIMKHEGFFESSTSNSTQAQTSGQIFVSAIVRVLNYSMPYAVFYCIHKSTPSELQGVFLCY